MTLVPVPAFEDNYIWLVHDGHRALVVDPGDAAPVLQALQTLGLALQTILVTHHHADHTGGVSTLVQATRAQVFRPRLEAQALGGVGVGEGDTIPHDADLDLNLTVLDVPGHTRGHAAYLARPLNQAPVLFCGDTLFSAGCGRLFEGTPEQMHASLDRLAVLPDDTRVCCAHEYTASCLRFASAVEPTNPDIAAHAAKVARWRAQGQPSLPSTLGLERRINPFLRCHVAAVQRAAQAHSPTAQTPVQVFAALRSWRDHWSA